MAFRERMGNFYTNVTLRAADQPGVVEVLRTAQREALVSQPANGCIVVYDRESEDQDIEVLKRLGGLLSAKLRCVALALLNHDDDVLAYWLHDNGKLVDEYVSAPAFFDDSSDSEEPDGGDANVLCRAFGAESSAARVEEILRARRAGGGNQGYVFEYERHEALATALGLPPISIASGFNYIDDGEFPEDTTEADFVRIE